MKVRIVEERGSHLLVAQGDRFAIVERRNDRLYNCHGHDRDAIAADKLSAIDLIVEDGDWVDEATGRAAFKDVIARGKELAEHLW